METSHHSTEFPHVPSQAVAQPHCVSLSPLVSLWMSFGCSSIHVMWNRRASTRVPGTFHAARSFTPVGAFLPLTGTWAASTLFAVNRSDLTFLLQVFGEHVVVQSRSTLQPHVLQHTRLLCPPLSPRACSNLCPLSQGCHPNISSSVVPFSSCLQSFPASGFFPMSQLTASGDQSIGASASASVLPMNIQD